MVMVTKNQKPAKNARKGDQITDANGAQISYYRHDFQPSRRSDPSRRSKGRSSRSEGHSNGAHTGLINADVICYSNAIFQCIAVCANLGYCEDFLWSLPIEEH